LSVIFPSVNFFKLFSCPSNFAIAACDGSVQSLQGTFGWVLAWSNPRRILVKCSGPACGACMDSYRTETLGLLSLITFLHLLRIYYKSPLPPTDIWCDNLAVVKTVNKIKSRNPESVQNSLMKLLHPAGTFFRPSERSFASTLTCPFPTSRVIRTVHRPERAAVTIATNHSTEVDVSRLRFGGCVKVDLLRWRCTG
jgi:hypothetical protein